MANKNELIKEAMETISSLVTSVEQLTNENLFLKQKIEREKVAAELEVRGLVTYEKLASIKDNTISDEEFKEMKDLLKIDPYSSNFYRPIENNSQEIVKTASDAFDYRRNYRIEYLSEELSKLNNQY